jgi:CHASE3 domain sensor protein
MLREVTQDEVRQTMDILEREREKELQKAAKAAAKAASRPQTAVAAQV